MFGCDMFLFDSVFFWIIFHRNLWNCSFWLNLKSVSCGGFIGCACMYVCILSVFVTVVCCVLSVYIWLLLIICVKGKKGIHLFKLRENEYNIQHCKKNQMRNSYIYLYMYVHIHIHTMYMYILREKKIKCNKNYDHTA